MPQEDLHLLRKLKPRLSGKILQAVPLTIAPVESDTFFARGLPANRRVASNCGVIREPHLRTRSDHFTPGHLNWLRKCLRSRRYRCRLNYPRLSQLRADRRRYEWNGRYRPGHVCDVHRKRLLIHCRLLPGPNRPIPAEPNRASQFHSGRNLRDHHHSCDRHLKTAYTRAFE
jgi:hypothetical protein